MKEEEKDKKKSILIKISIGIVIISAIVFSIVMSLAPLEVINLDVRFNATNDRHIAPGLNSSALDFGKVSPGETVTTLKVDLIDTREFPVNVDFFASENIVDFLEVKNTIIPPKTEVRIPITLRPPKNMSFGDYSGKLKVVITKSK